MRILDDFAYGIIAQREIEGRDGKNTVDTDVSGLPVCRTAGRSCFAHEGNLSAARLQLLSLYMALRDESGEPLSREALRDALLNLIMCVTASVPRLVRLDT